MILTGWANLLLASRDSGRDLSMLKRNLADADNHPANYVQVYEKEPGHAVSPDLEELELAGVVRELRQKMNVGVARARGVELGQQVTFNAEYIGLYELLDTLLVSRGLEFLVSQDRNVLIIREREAVRMDEAEVQESVRGRVGDAATNEPLPGENVIIEGTCVGTSTDTED